MDMQIVGEEPTRVGKAPTKSDPLSELNAFRTELLLIQGQNTKSLVGISNSVPSQLGLKNSRLKTYGMAAEAFVEKRS